MNDLNEFRWFMFRNIFDDFFLIKYRKCGSYWIETDDEIQVDGYITSSFKMKCIVRGINEYWLSDNDRFQFMGDVFRCEDIDQHFYAKSVI